MRESFGAEFDLPAGYLNTPSAGVPPVRTTAAMTEALSQWSRGEGAPDTYEEAVEGARAAFGSLVGVAAERVTVGGSVAQLVGLVAASVPDGASVLVAEREFTSVSFPFAAQADRGVTVTEVELAELPARAPDFDYVAVGVVQSSDGRIVDLDALRAATASSGTRVVLDASQAVGWLPLRLDWADWVAGAGYKFLMTPRGAAWMAVRPNAPTLRPHSAGPAGCPDFFDSIYGLPLRLADTAQRYDISAGWLSHIGAAASMTWLADLDVDKVSEHCVGLADQFLSRLGLPAAGSAIVSLDLPGSADALAGAGVTCSHRAGRTRFGFHLYNTEEDVDLAVRAVRAA